MNKVRYFVERMRRKAIEVAANAKVALRENQGALGTIELVILIVIVLLILGVIFFPQMKALFLDVIMPKLKALVEDIFNFKLN